MGTTKSGRYKKRTHQEPLDEAWANALLEGLTEDLKGGPLTIHARLKDARAYMHGAVVAARRSLSKNPLRETVAQAAARNAGRRGHANIVISDEGEVMLEVSYTQDRKTEAEAATPTKRSKLPLIDEIRAEAESLEIDTAPFGRSKVKLRKAIAEARAKKADTKPKTQVKKAEAKPETEPEPKPKAQVKKAEPAPDPEPEDPKSPGKLAQIAAEAGNVDISKIASEEKIPPGPDDDGIDDLLSNFVDEGSPG